MRRKVLKAHTNYSTNYHTFITGIAPVDIHTVSIANTVYDFLDKDINDRCLTDDGPITNLLALFLPVIQNAKRARYIPYQQQKKFGRNGSKKSTDPTLNHPLHQ